MNRVQLKLTPSRAFAFAGTLLSIGLPWAWTNRVPADHPRGSAGSAASSRLITGGGDATRARSSAVSSGAMSSSAASTSAASTGSGTACVYPTSDPGYHKGQVIPENAEWQGFVDGSDTVTTVHIEDFYDCDGSKGINALLVDTSAAWCSTCEEEGRWVGKQLASDWATLGIRVLTLMIQDAHFGTPTTKTARVWEQVLKLGKGATVVADPKQVFIGSAAAEELPINAIVDPRTMKVVSITDGYLADTLGADVMELAKKNNGSR